MSENNFDIIMGKHSISTVFRLNTRRVDCLYATDDGLQELRKEVKIPKDVKIKLLAPHALQEEAKRYFSELNFEYTRVPSGLFLKVNAFDWTSIDQCYEDILKNDKIKILCLDQITDVHNGAAILRSASFYGVDYIVFSSKKHFGFAPNFYRIASGATESLKLIAVANLSRFLRKISESGVHVIGLSEHAEDGLEQALHTKTALVVGSEDKGISNAVMRCLDEKLALKSLGDIKSLNVSVAAAIGMERCLSF